MSIAHSCYYNFFKYRVLSYQNTAALFSSLLFTGWGNKHDNQGLLGAPQLALHSNMIEVEDSVSFVFHLAGTCLSKTSFTN